MLFKIFNLFCLLTIVSSRSIIDEYKFNTQYVLEENEEWNDTIINKMNIRIDNRNIFKYN